MFRHMSLELCSTGLMGSRAPGAVWRQIESLNRTFRIITAKSELKMIVKENCAYEVALPTGARLRFFSRP